MASVTQNINIDACSRIYYYCVVNPSEIRYIEHQLNGWPNWDNCQRYYGSTKTFFSNHQDGETAFVAVSLRTGIDLGWVSENDLPEKVRAFLALWNS